MECEPKKIKVMGTAEKLNKITMITIPGEALDISGAKETLTKMCIRDRIILSHLTWKL